MTAVEREAATSDALAESGLHPFELGDPLLDASSPPRRKLRPVSAFRCAVTRQLCELQSNLLQRKADLLCEHNEGHEPEYGSRISAMPRIGPFGRDQTLVLVEPERRCRHPAPFRDLANGQGTHDLSLVDFGLDFKCT